MGNDQSKQGGAADADQANAPTQYMRMDGDRSMNDSKPSNRVKTVYGGTLAKMAYAAIWSIRSPIGKGPKPRTGHFTAHSPELHTIFIGYGTSHREHHLKDVWALDTDTCAWRKLKLSGDAISSRTGASACMMGKFIVVFGGNSGNTYFTDLHTIDTETGYVQKADVGGDPPSPRAYAVLGIYNNKLFVWGGFDGQSNPKDIAVMEFATMSWKRKETMVEGRSHAAYATCGTKIYGYGGSQAGGLIEIDMERESVEIVTPTGAIPGSDASFAGMVSTGKYLVFFGGKTKDDRWTLIYAMDIEKKWWFVLFVNPDGITTSTADGRISNDGLMTLPQFSKFSCAFAPRNREIFAFLGHPHKNPTPLFVVSVGEALGTLNLREDMTKMFQMTSL